MDFKCTSQRLIAYKHQEGEHPKADRHEFKFVARNDPESKVRMIKDNPDAYRVGEYYKLALTRQGA